MNTPQSYDQGGIGWSVGVDGLTRLNDPLNLSEQADGLISYTDPTGAEHTFIEQQSSGKFDGQWTSPPGEFLHLRQWSTPGASGYNWNQTWAITTTNGTTYFFDGLGYESGIQDRVGNTMVFNRTLVSPLGAVGSTICENPITSTVISLLSGVVSGAAGGSASLGAGCEEETTSIQDEGSIQAQGRLAVGAAPPTAAVASRELQITYQSPTTVSAIASITDRAGQTLAFAYNSNNTLKSVVEGTGATARTFAFSYVTSQPLAASALNGLLGVSGVGSVTSGPAELTSITDPRQDVTSLSYASNGTQASGTAAPCPTAGSAPAGSQLLAALADLEPVCVTSLKDRAGGTTSFSYDVSSPSGKTTCAASSECTEVQGPQKDQNANPELWFTSLDSSLRPIETVDPLGRETQSTWNEVSAPAPNTVAQAITGEVAAGFSTQPAAACEQYTYDADGDVLSDLGPSEGSTCPTSPFRKTAYTYNLSNGPLALHAPSGLDSSGTYVSDIATKTLNSASGPETTTYTYDTSSSAADNDGLLTSVKDPDGQTWSTTYYTGTPNSVAVYTGSTATTVSTAFGGGLIKSQTDPQGNTTDYGNAVGQFSTGPLAVNNGYDPNGLPELVYQPGQFSPTTPSTSTPSVDQYDADGDLIARTDPRYWTDKNPTSITLIPGADTTTSTDPVITQANVTTPFTSYYAYDPFDDQVQSWTPKDTAVGAAGTWLTDQTSYDANANTVSTTVGNQITNGTSSTPSTSPAVTTNYSYTAMDQQDTKTVQLGASSTEASASGGTTQVTTYCYDLNGYETDEVLPAGQSTATTCPGGLALSNNLPSGSTHAIHYVLDADGDRLVSEQISSELNGNALQSAQDQLTSAVYDAAGNQIATADPADNNGATVTVAESNAQAALSGASIQWRTRTVYDAVGDPIATVENPGVQTAAATSTSAASYRFYDSFNQYDAAGNLIASETAKDTLAQGVPTLNASTGQYELAASAGVNAAVPGITTYSYDLRNLLVSETNPDGDETLYGRQSDGKICWIMSPNGVHYQQQQSTPQLNSNLCTSAQQTLPYTTGYNYTAQGWVSQITLPEAPNEYSYPAGEMQVAYSYDLVGDPTTITDPDANPITDQFYDTGDLKQTSAPWWWTTDLGGSSANGSGPDPNTGGTGQLSPQTPGQGLVLQQKSLEQIFQEDNQASSSSPSLPSDGVSGQLGDVAASPLPGILPNAGTTALGYDGFMQLTSVAGPEALSSGQTVATTGSALMTYLTYDPDGNITSLTQPFDGATTTANPNSSITSYTYDPDGNTLTETDPAVASAAGLGQYVASGNLNGSGAPQSPPKTTYSYDGLDRLQSVSAPGAGISDASQTATTDTTRYCYYVDPTGSASAAASDTNGCPTDPGSSIGKPLSVAEPGGLSVAISQRVLTINPSNQASTVDYDADGDELAATDPLGNETSYSYDPIGDQTSITRPKGNPSYGPNLSFGSAPTAPLAGYTSTNTYDQAGLLTQTVDGSKQASTYAYDQNGNLTSQSLPGAADSSTMGTPTVPQITDYTYNGRGLLWTTTTGAGGLGSSSDGQSNARTTVVETDGDGNVVRTVNPAGTVAGGLPYYSYNQGYSSSGEPTSSPTVQTASDEANIDATINVYDSNNQLTNTYLPWGCDLSANTSKPATASGFCTPAQATSTDPRRWRIDYARTQPASTNGDWVASVSQPFQWTTLTSAPTSGLTSFDYLPNGWVSGDTGPSYQDGTNTVSQTSTAYLYDAAGDQINDQATPTITAPLSVTVGTSRNIWRSYWPDGQPQQTDGYGSHLADHTYDYYWNPTGQLSEVATGSFTANVSSQTPAEQACYDADSRIQRVYQTVNTPNGVNNLDTFYAYDADGNEIDREANGIQTVSSSSPLCGTLAQGQLPSSYSGGQLSSFTYDNLDRPTNLTVSSNSGASTAQPSRTYANTYFPSGELASQTRAQSGGSASATQSWYYNDDASIASTTTNDGEGTQNYAYDSDGNLTASANGTHLYNALDQEVQWTRSGTNTANPGGTVNYLYDGDGALMQEQTSTPTINTTQSGLPVSASQQSTTLFCSSSSAPTPSTGETPTQAAGTTAKPACSLDNGRAETVQTYSTSTLTVAGVPASVLPQETTQSYCYDGLGDLTQELESPDVCGTTSPAPQNTSSSTYNVFGQQVSSTVPFPSTTNPDQTLSTSTTYDPLGRNVYQTQTLSGQASTQVNTGYLGLSSDVSSASGTTANGTAYQNTYDYDSAGDPLGLFTTATASANSPGSYYSYLLSPTGSVLGLEGTAGTIATQDAYHYTATGELELGSNQLGASVSDLLGNQDPDSALSVEAQANQILFDGYLYNQGSPPSGAAGIPGTDSYSAAARTYLPGSDAWQSPDTFEQGAANEGLALAPGTQELYAFDAGNPTSNIDGDGHGIPLHGTPHPCDPTAGSLTSSCGKLRLFANPNRPGSFQAGGKTQLTEEANSPQETEQQRAQDVLDLLTDEARQAQETEKPQQASLTDLNIANNLSAEFCTASVACLQEFESILFPPQPTSSGGGLLNLIPFAIDALGGGPEDPFADGAAGIAEDLIGSEAADAGADSTEAEAVDELATAAESPNDVAHVLQAEKESGAFCGGQSFSHDTKVKLANGKAIRISDLHVGARVLATDPATGVTKSERVTAVWVNHDHDLLDLTVRTAHGNALIRTTQHHPVYDITQHGWVQAAHLATGDQLKTANHALVTVVSATAVTGQEAMWDLTISQDHDFYVLAGSSWVLVHNINDDDCFGGAEDEPYQMQLFPTKAYDRVADYGRTPTAEQQASVPAGMEFDHDPPLVVHYYEGQGDGGLAGFNQTQAEREAYGASLENGGPASPNEQRIQGGQLAAYSRAMKSLFGL